MKAYPINLTHNSAMFGIRTDEGAVCDLVYFATTNKMNNMTVFWICLVDLIRLLEDAIQHTPEAFVGSRFIPATTVEDYELRLSRASGTNPDRLAIYISRGNDWIYIGNTEEGVPGAIKFFNKFKDMAAELLELNINGIGNFEKTLDKCAHKSRFKAKWYSYGDLSSVQWVGNTFSVSNWDVREGRSRVEIVSGLHSFSHAVPVRHFDEIKELINICHQAPSGPLMKKEFDDGVHLFVSKIPSLGGWDVINLVILNRFAVSSIKIPAADEYLPVLMDAFTIDLTLPGVNGEDF